jgi:hypothetical protein
MLTSKNLMVFSIIQVETRSQAFYGIWMHRWFFFFLNKYGYQTQNLLDLFVWERESTFKNHGDF